MDLFTSTITKVSARTYKFLPTILIGILVVSLLSTSSNAQTASPYGFEDGASGTFASWAGNSSSETVSLNTNTGNSRTGSNSIKLNTTSTSNNKQWYGVNPYDSSYNNETIFFIYWAKADVAGMVADASYRYSSSIPVAGSSGSSSNAAGGVALSTTTWTRVTNSISNSSARYYFSAPRKTAGPAGNIYLDDGILYTSLASNPTVDTFKPGAPSALTVQANGNLASLSWTSNADNTNSATGVQATILLRNLNTAAAAPVLNDQAVYSVAGGASGPNTASNGWTIVSTTLGATATAYLDAAPVAGTYIYAVVLRDFAYNYSLAAVSSPVVVGNPSPTIFTNTTGFTNNFGGVVTGSTSAVSQYSVTAYNLTSSLVATAPAGFQLSLTGTGGWSSTVSIPQIGGSIASTPIYVQYTAGAPTGSTGTLNITNTSTGSNTANVPVIASAIALQPTTVGSISFGTITGNSIAVNLPTVGNGTNRIIVVSPGTPTSFVPTDGVPVTGVNANYTLAANQGSGNVVVYDGTGSGNNVVTVTGLNQATQYYFTVYEYNVGTGASQNYLLSPGVTGSASTIAIIPTIMVSQTAFNGAFGNEAMSSISASQQFTVTGIYLTNDIVITAPANFGVSTTNGGPYLSTITLPQSGGNVAATTIYVAFAPTVANGATGTQNITLTSIGVANAQSVSVSGNALAVEPTRIGTISFGTVNTNSIMVNLPTVGNGGRRIIVANLGSPAGFAPTDGVAVSGVNANYNLAATQTGGGKIIYDGIGSGNGVVTMTNLDSGTLYYFTVYEYNVGTGTSQNYFTASAASSDITTSFTQVGVKNINAIATSIKLYPNPVTNYLYISAPVPVSFTIRDMQGRAITGGTNTERVNMESFAPGVYIISITDEAGAILKVDKLIKTL